MVIVAVLPTVSTVDEVLGNVIVVESVPANVKELLIAIVLPLPSVNVAVLAGFVIVTLLIVELPVDVPPILIVPEPLASMVRFSFVDPFDTTETARPPPETADFTLSPVMDDAVDASTLNAGPVVPLGPTARALADAEVIV